MTVIRTGANTYAVQSWSAYNVGIAQNTAGSNHAGGVAGGQRGPKTYAPPELLPQLIFRSGAPPEEVDPGTIIDLTGEGLEHTRALGSPFVVAHPTPAGLVHSRALGDPFVTVKITPASLTRTRALGDVTVQVGSFIAPASLTRTRALGSPFVTTAMAPAGLTRARAQGTPTLVTMSYIFPGSLVHTREQPAPTVPGVEVERERMKRGVGT